MGCEGEGKELKENTFIFISFLLCPFFFTEPRNAMRNLVRDKGRKVDRTSLQCVCMCVLIVQLFLCTALFF